MLFPCLQIFSRVYHKCSVHSWKKQNFKMIDRKIFSHLLLCCRHSCCMIEKWNFLFFLNTYQMHTTYFLASIFQTSNFTLKGHYFSGLILLIPSSGLCKAKTNFGKLVGSVCIVSSTCWPDCLMGKCHKKITSWYAFETSKMYLKAFSNFLTITYSCKLLLFLNFQDIRAKWIIKSLCVHSA